MGTSSNMTPINVGDWQRYGKSPLLSTNTSRPNVRGSNNMADIPELNSLLSNQISSTKAKEKNYSTAIGGAVGDKTVYTRQDLLTMYEILSNEDDDKRGVKSYAG